MVALQMSMYYATQFLPLFLWISNSVWKLLEKVSLRAKQAAFIFKLSFGLKIKFTLRVVRLLR